MEHKLHVGFVAVYLFALIGVGAMKARKIRSQEDFSLAGRGLGTFVLIGTLLATWIGTGSIFGNAQKTYQIGVGAFILPIAGVLGIAVLWRLAASIREMEVYTIQDILEKRFGVATRIIGMIALMLAYVIIVSYQYRAGAAVVGRLVPGLDGSALAVIIVAVFVIAYTALAGMYSVAYTDVVNGVLMVVGLCFAIPLLFSDVGGFEGIRSSLPADQVQMTASYTPVRLVNWLLPTLLLILGDANVYQRFFSAKDPGVARRSAAWLILGIAVLECAIIALALLGRVMVEQGKLPAPENVAHIVVSIAFDALPPLLGAMLMGTVVAIVVSTADSFLLAPSTSFVRDVYKRFLKPDASEESVVFLGRVVVIVFGLVALGMAFTSDKFFEVALFAYTIYGASITPVMIAAFFWPRATLGGAVASMLTGVIVALGWQWAQMGGQVASLGESIGWAGLAEVDAVLPALSLSVLALVSVSLMQADPRSPSAS
ncbi:MAG: sodium:solute symporter family protein [bacterium]|nr:sodium:solute symporter family protein [bacterium]